MRYCSLLLTIVAVSVATVWGLSSVGAIGADNGPQRYYVKADATGLNTGASWEDAYTGLQTALANAPTCVTGTCTIIWVAAGTYYPTSDLDRTISFVLKPGVSIYGGFAGSETEPAQRDPVRHATVLSGDIGLPGDDSDNSFHVVTDEAAADNAVLDGFVIIGGNADANPSVNLMHSRGGGLHISGSPLLANLVVTGNMGYHGGGMYTSGSPVLTDVTFGNNVARDWDVARRGTINAFSCGGGLYVDSGGAPRLTNVIFQGNAAQPDNLNAVAQGGGMYVRSNPGGPPVLLNVTFDGNTAAWGGGLYHQTSLAGTILITNTVFFSNTAYMDGGGLYIGGLGNPQLANCTFANNVATARWGGGVYAGSSRPVLVNSILWANHALGSVTMREKQIHLFGVGSATVTYSLIAGGIYTGTGNLSADPQFADLLSGDLRLLRTSPAVDAGNNNAVLDILTDREGKPRFLDVPDAPDSGLGTPPIVDMGAYEAVEYITYLPLILAGHQ